MEQTHFNDLFAFTELTRYKARQDSGMGTDGVRERGETGRGLERGQTDRQAQREARQKISIIHGSNLSLYSHLELQKLNAEMQALETSYASTQDHLFQELCNKVSADWRARWRGGGRGRLIDGLTWDMSHGVWWYRLMLSISEMFLLFC